MWVCVCFRMCVYVNKWWDIFGIWVDVWHLHYFNQERSWGTKFKIYKSRISGKFIFAMTPMQYTFANHAGPSACETFDHWPHCLVHSWHKYSVRIPKRLQIKISFSSSLTYSMMILNNASSASPNLNFANTYSHNLWIRGEMSLK